MKKPNIFPVFTDQQRFDTIEALGRLFDYMEAEGIKDDTLIIYTSDHGEMLGDYNCFGKKYFLDFAARIPMFIKYPGCPKGKICDEAGIFNRHNANNFGIFRCCYG